MPFSNKTQRQVGMRKQGSKKLLRIIQKTKQNGQSPSLTLTTLNANRLDSVIKRHRSAERIKKKNRTQLYTVYRRLTSYLKKTFRLKSERTEKICKCKQSSKERCNDYINLRVAIQSKKKKITQTLHMDERVNQPRRHNN